MELANVVIKFGAEGEKDLVSAIKLIGTNTKNTSDALTTMNTILKAMSSKGIEGVKKQLKETGSAATEAQHKFADWNDAMSKYALELGRATTVSQKYRDALLKLGKQYGVSDQELQRWLPNIKKAEEYIRKKSVALDAAGRDGKKYYDSMDRVVVMEKMAQDSFKNTSIALRQVTKATEKASSQFSTYRKIRADTSSENAIFLKSVQKIGNTYGYLNKTMDRFIPDLKKAEEYIRKKSVAMNAAGRNGQAYYEKMSRVAVMERMLNGRLGASSKAFKQLKQTVESTTTAMKKNAAATATDAKGIRNLIPHVAAVTLSYMAMRRAVNALKEAFAAGVDYEQQMAHVGAIARATAEEFDLLSDAARNAGETTVWTATEAATALRYLSMAGFSAAESVESLAGVLNLALIGEMDLGRATDIATDTLRAFGLEASELDKVVDVMVGTITRSNTNIEKMGQALKYVAPVAAKLGYTVEDVSAMIGVLSQSGIKSGIAGRALRMSFLRSGNAAKILGMETGNLIDVLRELNARDLAPEELTSTLKDLFGIRSTPALLTLMQGMEQLENFTETLRNAEGETKKYVDRLDTVKVAWEKLKSVMTDVAIEVFTDKAKDLKTVLKDLTQLIKDNKGELKGFADTMADFSTFVAGPTFKMVVQFMKNLAAPFVWLNNAGNILNSVYNKLGDSIARQFTNERALKKAAEEANAVLSEQLATLAEMAEMEDEFDGIAEAVGNIAHEIRMWGDAQSKLRGIMSDVVKDSNWWDLVPLDEVEGSEKIKRLQAIADYTKKITEQMKSDYKDYYDSNNKLFRDYIKARVAGFKEQYDQEISFIKGLAKADRDYTAKATAILNQFTNGPYKDAILEQANLVMQAEILKLNSVGAGSEEALEIIKRGQKARLTVLKDGISEQKSAEKDLENFRKKIYKEDTTSQLIATMEKFAAIKKVLGDTVELETLKEQILKGIRKKGVDEELRLQNAKRTAMKSMYTDMSKFPVQFYQSLEKAVDIEFDNYMQKLGLKGIAIRDFTKDQAVLYKDLLKWKSLKLESPFDDVIKDIQGSFSGDIFGDSMDQGLNNAMGSLTKLIDMYKELAVILTEQKSLQEAITVKIAERDKLIEKGSDAGNTEEETARIAELHEQIISGGRKAEQAQLTSISVQTAAWGQMFGALKGMYEKDSTEYKVFAAAQMAATVAQIAVQAMLAVVAQGSGDPYTAWARIAAMAALMAGLVASVGGTFGGSAAGGAAPDVGSTQEFLSDQSGSWGTESFTDVYDMLDDNDAEQYAALLDIYYEIRQLNSNITALATSVAKGTEEFTVDVPAGEYGAVREVYEAVTNVFGKVFKLITSLTGPLFNPIFDWITGFIGDVISGITGGVKSYELWDVGIWQQGSLSLQAFMDGMDMTFEWWTKIREHTSGGWFREDDLRDFYETDPVSDAFSEKVNDVFRGITTSVLALADIFGMTEEQINTIMSNFKIDLPDIGGFDNATPEQIAKKFESWFTNFGDDLAEAFFGDLIRSFLKADEGFYEGAVRIAMELVTVQEAIKMTGNVVKTNTAGWIQLSQALIEAAGGLNELMDSIELYFNEFLTGAEQFVYLTDTLKSSFDSLEIAFPETRQGFKDLIDGLDLTNEADQKLYVALLAIAGVTDAYYDILEKRQGSLEKLQRKNAGFSDDDYMISRANAEFAGLAGVAGWFKTATEADVTWFATRLNITWEEALAYVEAIGTGIKDFELSKVDMGLITEAEYESTQLERIADRYKSTGMSATELLAMFADMSFDKAIDFADSLGISFSDLTSDMALLAGVSGRAAAALEDLMEAIRNKIAAINNIIDSLSETLHPKTSQDVLNEINVFKMSNPDDWSESDITDLGGLITKWYSLATQEAEAKARLLEQEKQMWDQVKTTVASLLSSVDSTINGIKYSDLNRNPQAMLADAGQDYNKLLARATTGGEADVEAFLAFAPQYLQMMMGQFGSSQTYLSAYEKTLADLELVGSFVDSTDFSQKLYDAQVAANTSIVADLSGINETAEEMLKWLKSVAESLSRGLPEGEGFASGSQRLLEGGESAGINETAGEMFEWLRSFLPGLSEGRESAGINGTAGEMFEWLRSFLPELSEGGGFASDSNSRVSFGINETAGEMFEWLRSFLPGLSEGGESASDPNLSEINETAKEMFEWLKSGPDSNGINETAEEMLKWLKSVAESLSRGLPEGEGFALGGIATGPDSGYLALLHGTEMITPIRNLAVPAQAQNNNQANPGPMNIHIQVGTQHFDAYVDARADNVRVTANKTSGSEHKRLYYAPAN